MITPEKKDLTIYQGVSFKKAWEIVDKEGNPIDLSGWSAFCHFRRRVKDEDIILELSTANGLLFIDQDSEKTVYGISLPPEQTRTLSMKAAVYDINLVDPEGDKVRIQEGTITISPAVTRVWEQE